MAIQIEIPRKNGGTPLYTAAIVVTGDDGVIKWFQNKVDVGWIVYADAIERANDERPLFTFGTRFSASEVIPFTHLNLKGKIDTALVNRCIAEESDPLLNNGNRILPRLRDAIIAGTIVAD